MATSSSKRKLRKIRKLLNESKWVYNGCRRYGLYQNVYGRWEQT
jgi:hypothetical protein